MDTLLDSKYVVYTVIGLLPNLLLMLWALARLSREVRLLFAKLSLLEGEVRLLDQGLNSLSEEARKSRVEGAKAGAAAAKPGDPDPGKAPLGSGGFW